MACPLFFLAVCIRPVYLVAFCLFCLSIKKKLWQVFPLLIEKFSFKEQASLVWQFLCSIPVNMMAEFLPWLSSSISSDEHQDMHKCLRKIVPEEKLLQQVNVPFNCIFGPCFVMDSIDIFR